jgi:ssDNA-binding Zn-finger/Zn-ribbon topoisomerase 1
MPEFGECPECGKMTLILVKRRRFGGKYLYAKCVNPDCRFEEEVEEIEEEDEE